MLAESHFLCHKTADVLGLSDMSWIIHEYFKYAGFTTGQVGKVAP
jgi:hypothetical protein